MKAIFCFILLLIFVTCFYLSCLDWTDEASTAFDSSDDKDDSNKTSDDDDNNDDDDESDEEVWTDLTTGLMWQNYTDCCYNWDEAKSYCPNLSWGGYDDWRQPTISELRSLIRGCSTTETGGSCGVTDSCLDSSCYDSSCYECSYGGGPADGCYLPSELSSNCSYFWSSSAVADSVNSAWYVYFINGHVSHDNINGDVSGGTGSSVRCVR